MMTKSGLQNLITILSKRIIGRAIFRSQPIILIISIILILEISLIEPLAVVHAAR